MNLHWDWVEKIVKRRAVKACTLEVKLSKDCPYHPPLINFRCHENSFWHLKNTKEVVKVAQGFYLDGNEVVAHFICQDIYGDWFDPTLPMTWLSDNKFYVTKTFDKGVFVVPRLQLSEEKERIKQLVPFFLRPLFEV